MTTEIDGFSIVKIETFFERQAWKVLLGVSLIIGLFGVMDMVDGASDLQKGEAVLMHSLSGMSWNDLMAGNPEAANIAESEERTRLYEKFKAASGNFVKYEQGTRRVLPVIRFTPT